MEPTELYNKNKRNLAIFAGILAVFVLGGVDEESHLEIFGLQINVGGLFIVALFAINLYLIYQFWFAWSRQTPDLQREIWYDFAIPVAFSSLILLWAAIAAAREMVEELGTSELISVFAIVVAALLAISFHLYSRATALDSEVVALRKRTLLDRLLIAGWALVFSPQSGARKPISFLHNNSIGEGRNQNESTWNLDGEILTIRKANGALQNRFRYNKEDDRFYSTDEAEADAVKRGIPGQYIYREKPLPADPLA